MLPETFSIPVTTQVIPDGYHGISRSEFEKIEKRGFKSSKGKKDWLGDGVYFWESTPATAKWWVNSRELREWVIIKASLALGACFNFANPEHCDILDACREMFAENERPECSDAAIINFLAENNLCHIDSVRCAFQYDNKPLYDGSRICRYNQMICMRTIGNITQIEIFESGEKDDK